MDKIINPYTITEWHDFIKKTMEKCQLNPEEFMISEKPQKQIQQYTVYGGNIKGTKPMSYVNPYSSFSYKKKVRNPEEWM